MNKATLLFLTIVLFALPSFAADPIEGTWKVDSVRCLNGTTLPCANDIERMTFEIKSATEVCITAETAKTTETHCHAPYNSTVRGNIDEGQVQVIEDQSQAWTYIQKQDQWSRRTYGSYIHRSSPENLTLQATYWTHSIYKGRVQYPGRRWEKSYFMSRVP